MEAIDWSKAPEGATHYAIKAGVTVWLKVDDVSDCWSVWNLWGDSAWAVGLIAIPRPIPRPTPTAIPVDQPKQLTRAVFDGLPSEYRWAVVGRDGICTVFSKHSHYEGGWYSVNNDVLIMGHGYNSDNWQNSLIERDVKPEQTLAQAQAEIEQLRAELKAKDEQSQFTDAMHKEWARRYMELYSQLRIATEVEDQATPVDIVGVVKAMRDEMRRLQQAEIERLKDKECDLIAGLEKDKKLLLDQMAFLLTAAMGEHLSKDEYDALLMDSIKIVEGMTYMPFTSYVHVIKAGG